MELISWIWFAGAIASAAALGIADGTKSRALRPRKMFVRSCPWRVRTGGKRLHSVQRVERANSRKCALHALFISSASYAECALYLAVANDGQTAGPSHWRNSFTNDCSRSGMLRVLERFIAAWASRCGRG